MSDKHTLSQEQITWLSALLRKLESGEEINERALKIELRGQLPAKFDPLEIPHIFLRGSTHITPLGIYLVNPNSDIIQRADRVVKQVQSLLLEKHTITNISADYIANTTNLKCIEVAEIFESLSHLGVFHSSGTSYHEDRRSGWGSITIDQKAFDGYLNYEGFDVMLKQYIDIEPKDNDKNLAAVEVALTPLTSQETSVPDSHKVFVVHGRNLKARDAMFEFLRALELSPIQWGQAEKIADKPSPTTLEVIDAGLSIASAIVVLLTGDDWARLREEFHSQHEPSHEANDTPQARPNVIFEAGIAFGRYRERTVLVEMGYTRPFSDVSGINTVRFGIGL